MKSLFNLVLLSFALGVNAQATVFTYSGTGGAIPDNDPSGRANVINVGDVGAIESVRVHLNISGGYNGDLYAYLTHDGQMAILLNRIGTTGVGTYGSSQAGMNIWLDAVSASNVYTAGTLASAGSYAADGRFADPDDLSTINLGYSIRDLSSFGDGNAEGDWTLFISDMNGGAVSTLNSWDLEITAVPEPTTWALIGFAVIFVTTKTVRWFRQRHV